MGWQWYNNSGTQWSQGKEGQSSKQGKRDNSKVWCSQCYGFVFARRHKTECKCGAPLDRTGWSAQMHWGKSWPTPAEASPQSQPEKSSNAAAPGDGAAPSHGPAELVAGSTDLQVFVRQLGTFLGGDAGTSLATLLPSAKAPERSANQQAADAWNALDLARKKRTRAQAAAKKADGAVERAQLWLKEAETKQAEAKKELDEIEKDWATKHAVYTKVHDSPEGAAGSGEQQAFQAPMEVELDAANAEELDKARERMEQSLIDSQKRLDAIKDKIRQAMAAERKKEKEQQKEQETEKEADEPAAKQRKMADKLAEARQARLDAEAALHAASEAEHLAEQDAIPQSP